MKTRIVISLSLLAALYIFGCGDSPPPVPPQAAAHHEEEASDPIVLLSVTSDFDSNPQAVDMAMKLAGFSLEEGRRVAMFFNVKGVRVPTQNMADDAAFQENEPLKTQLAGLIERGADVHVCPICMDALGVDKADLVEGAKVTTRPSLFANIGADTAVFTY